MAAAETAEQHAADYQAATAEIAERALPAIEAEERTQSAHALPRTAQADRAFPLGADESDWREPMPAEIAYFERLEQERLAREQNVKTAQAGTTAAR